MKQDEEAKHSACCDALPPGSVESAGNNDLLDVGKCHGSEEGSDKISDATGKECPSDDG